MPCSSFLGPASCPGSLPVLPDVTFRHRGTQYWISSWNMGGLINVAGHFVTQSVCDIFFTEFLLINYFREHCVYSQTTTE